MNGLNKKNVLTNNKIINHGNPQINEREDNESITSSTDSSNLVNYKLGNNNPHNNQIPNNNNLFDQNDSSTEYGSITHTSTNESRSSTPNQSNQDKDPQTSSNTGNIDNNNQQIIDDEVSSIPTDITISSNDNKNDQGDPVTNYKAKGAPSVLNGKYYNRSNDNNDLNLGGANNDLIKNKKTDDIYIRIFTLPLLIAQNKMLIAAICAVIVGVAAALIGFGIIPGGAGYLAFLSATGIPSYFVGIAGTTVAGSAVLGVAYKASFFRNSSESKSNTASENNNNNP